MSLIKCHNLSKDFGSTQALNNVSIELEGGKPIALVGPNGAGKTTLFSILCGYISATSGTVEILGSPAGSPTLLGRISALPQDAALDPNFSIASQLAFFASLQGYKSKHARAEAKRVLSLVGLLESANQKPDSLSHGMGKRVAIAQAMIGEPELVLLDEPTAGLDPANAKKLRELIDSLAQHTQFIISSHNLDELEKLCDQVIYLEKGQLTQSVSIQNNQDDNKFLTLTLTECDAQQVIQVLSEHPGIHHIESRNAKEFLIELVAISQKSTPDKPLNNTYEVESFIFQQLQKHHWQYKQLLNGKRLEDTLFS